MNITNLEYQYKNGFKLEINDLKFPIGEITTILGKNGSGKSTLIKSILGVVKPDVIDSDTMLTSSELRKKLGVLLEGTDSLYPRLSVWDNARYFCKIRTGTFNSSRVEAILDVLQISKYRNTCCQKLSTGNKRKAFLAVILATEPDYIFLDEPTLGLDLKSVEAVKRLLISNVSKCKVVVITSHDSGFIKDVSSKFYLISNGKILSSGSTEDEFESAFSFIRC